MSELLCNPESYRKKLKEIEQMEDPIGGLCQFYSEKKDMSYGAGIFRQLFVPVINCYNTTRYRALDVGYGPGAMVAEATKWFKFSHGVDVHNSRELVGEFLKRGNYHNWILLYSEDGLTIPSAYCYNFIYSWTVFMHLGTIEVAKRLLREIYNHLCDNGIAVIYFSRITRNPAGETLKEYLASVEKEMDFPPFIEYEGKLLNQINLRISLRYMQGMCKEIGFKILNTECSYKIENGEKIYLGQHGIVLGRGKDENY